MYLQLRSTCHELNNFSVIRLTSSGVARRGAVHEDLQGASLPSASCPYLSRPIPGGGAKREAS